MLLRENKAGNGYVSNYTLSISLNEARALGFVDEDGNRIDLEKVMDESHKQLIIRAKQPAQD